MSSDCRSEGPQVLGSWAKFQSFHFIFFPCYCDKIPQHKQFKGRGLTWGYRSRIQFHHGGEVRGTRTWGSSSHGTYSHKAERDQYSRQTHVLFFIKFRLLSKEGCCPQRYAESGKGWFLLGIRAWKGFVMPFGKAQEMGRCLSR